MMLIDSHCHLDYPDFADELDAVMARAEAAGVGLFLTISTSLAGFDKVRGIAERFDHVYCTVGVHPHEAAGDGQAASTAKLVALTAHPKVVGIGETGLDYYYDNSPRDTQAAVFQVHIDAACETGLPLIVHTRNADEDTGRMLTASARGGRLNGLLHCFSSGEALARQALDLGFYISFSGIITFKKAEELRAVAKLIPEDRVLVETDAPYLAPVPHRGKRNEPAFVAHTAATLAALRGQTREALAASTSSNFMRLFKKIPQTALKAPA
jgi:TatD DNase family protein